MNPSKPNLLLLHGALGAASQFSELETILNDSFTIHKLNFSGHGGRPVDRPFDIAHFAAEVIDFIDHQKIVETDIFGFSMGGYVALKAAQRISVRVRAVMTLGTKFNWNPETAATESSRLIPEIIEKKVPDFAHLLEERHSPADWKENMRATAEMMQRLGQSPDWVPGVDEIANRVLIAVGERDSMVSIDESRMVADNLANARLRVMPGVFHAYEQIDPVILANEIRDFMR